MRAAEASRPPRVNIIDVIFDDNPPPTRKRGTIILDSETHAQATGGGGGGGTIQIEMQAQTETETEERARRELPDVGGTSEVEVPLTRAELLSFALRMNSHQIAKELLLEEEDIKWHQSTSSFLTGNTDLVNAGSIRRELTEKQLFEKAVEEVERARARIIQNATKTQQQPQERERVTALVPERSESLADSEVYSEKYDSDFSADSIDGDPLKQEEKQSKGEEKDDEVGSNYSMGGVGSSLLRPPPSSHDHRIISDLTDMTDDYEDDYEEEDHYHNSALKQQCDEKHTDTNTHRDTNEEKYADKHDEENENEEEEGGGDKDVFDMLNELVDYDSDSEADHQQDDDEHEKSILKRLREAHGQRSSPSRLSRHATPTTNFYSAATSMVHSPHPQHNRPPADSLLLAEDLAALDLQLDLDMMEEREGHEHTKGHEEYSVQYSQLRSSDSSYHNHFSVGNNSNSKSSNNQKSFCANQTDISKYSKFSASTQASSGSPGESKEIDSFSLSRWTGGGMNTNDEMNNSDAGADNVINHANDYMPANTMSQQEQQLRVHMVEGRGGLSLPTCTPGKLSENDNIDFMISGGLNEWLVMNMKENTSIALRSLKKRANRELSETIPHPRDLLRDRFSVCAEVYQHYLSEAVQLHQQFDNEVRVRSLAHAFTGNILSQRMSQLPTSIGGNVSAGDNVNGRADRGCAVGNNGNDNVGSGAQPMPQKGLAQRRHSAKAKDDFDLGRFHDSDDGEATAMHQSEPKRAPSTRFYRQQSVGQKLASTSMQIECVSKLEGGRQDKGNEEEEEEEEEDKRSYHADSKQLVCDTVEYANTNTNPHYHYNDETILMSQSFDRKRNEIRKKNRRALFAAMQLGDIAGKLVLEKSSLSSSDSTATL